MPDGIEPLSVALAHRIADINAAAWDACAGVEGAAEGNPFVSHAFLSALEDSGSVGTKTGWAPHHLIVKDAGGRLLGAAPMYLKGHSYGEYVFDWGWAEAYERAGGQYYPKLQVSVPFTPVAGPRLMVRGGCAGELSATVQRTLIDAIQGIARENKLSSAHVTFPTEAEWTRLGEAGWLQRTGQQFHWENRGYATFDDFLGALASRKRKTIRKERQDVAASGVTIRPLTGDALKPEHWDAFHRFYIATSEHKWGHPYLTREFFHRIGETMADQIVLMFAEDGGRPIAGALNLMGGGVLYGRNWGSLGEYRFLHFEACYYQAIEFAIRHGLRRVEAGAQGPHKIQRGYLPSPTYSAHWIADPRFRAAVENFLDRERRHVADEMQELGEYSPFRKDQTNEPPA
ncbi:MAG: GNAT family N-acetyltransferase [Alphaproteobacteria bacterium]